MALSVLCRTSIFLSNRRAFLWSLTMTWYAHAVKISCTSVKISCTYGQNFMHMRSKFHALWSKFHAHTVKISCTSVKTSCTYGQNFMHIRSKFHALKKRTPQYKSCFYAFLNTTIQIGPQIGLIRLIYTDFCCLHV
jgi:hypothetical protein